MKKLEDYFLLRYDAVWNSTGLHPTFRNNLVPRFSGHKSRKTRISDMFSAIVGHIPGILIRLHGFPLSLQAYLAIVPLLGHEYLPNPF
jgi:hypothetical protein